MNEHDYHPHQEEAAPARPVPQDGDLETRLFAVAHEQMKHLSDLNTIDEAASSEPSGRAADSDEKKEEVDTDAFGACVFAAYIDLGLELADGRDPVADCETRYAGTWEDRSSFIRDQLDARGWDRALTELQVEWGIWPGDIVWDEGVLWEHFTENYWMNEQNGRVHAFRR